MVSAGFERVLRVALLVGFIVPLLAYDGLALVKNPAKIKTPAPPPATPAPPPPPAPPAPSAPATAPATQAPPAKPTLATVFGFLLIPAVVLLASGGVGTQMKMPPNVEAGLQHFAGGVVLAAVASELVPEMKKPEAPIWAIVLGFSAGVAMLLLIRKHFPEDGGDDDDAAPKDRTVKAVPQRLQAVEENLETLSKRLLQIENTGSVAAAKPEKDASTSGGSIPWGSIVPTLIDLFCDGMLVGLSFAAGAGAGLILAVSIALEMASVGAATYANMKDKGVKMVEGMGVIGVMALTIVVSGTLSFILADTIAGTPGYYAALAFGIAACLWLACEDLLMEAHESVDGEKWWITSLFFAGFLVPILLDKLGGD